MFLGKLGPFVYHICSPIPTLHILTPPIGEVGVNSPQYMKRFTHGSSHRRPPSANLSFQLSLALDPQQWGSNLSAEVDEPDDDLHAPDPEKKTRGVEYSRIKWSHRTVTNLGFMLLLCCGILALLLVFSEFLALVS